MINKLLCITLFFVCLTSISYAQNFQQKSNQQETSFEFINKDYKVTWVLQSGKYGLIDTKTKDFIISPIYDEAEMYHKNYSLIKKDGKYGFINHKGETITEVQYTAAKHHNDKLILVEKEGKFTFLEKISLTGRMFDFVENLELNVEYDMVINSYSDEYSIVMRDGKYGYINEYGEKIIPLEYDEVTLFDGQFAAVKKGNKWGAIDRNNGKIIDFKYQEMRSFYGEKVAVKKGNKWGIIDSQEKVILPIEYKYISNFNTDNIALVKNGKFWGAIDKAGKTVIDFKYDFDTDYIDLLQLTDGFVWLKKDGFWGTVDLNQNVVIPFKYNNIQTIEGDRITVEEEGQIKVINESGEYVNKYSK
ncbi:MAG: WG repeat-containing protein [Saprospiraceae bacterium]